MKLVPMSHAHLFGLGHERADKHPKTIDSCHRTLSACRSDRRTRRSHQRAAAASPHLEQKQKKVFAVEPPAKPLPKMEPLPMMEPLPKMEPLSKSNPTKPPPPPIRRRRRSSHQRRRREMAEDDDAAEHRAAETSLPRRPPSPSKSSRAAVAAEATQRRPIELKRKK